MITLIHEQETEQATFDFVVAKLREQGRPAVEGRGEAKACRYLLPDGRRCAAGHLMGDDAPTGSASSITRMLDCGDLEAPRFRHLIHAMQRAHDDPALDYSLDGRDWAIMCADHMINVAAAFKLDRHSALEWREAVVA